MAERVIQHISFDPDGSLQIATYDSDHDVTQTGLVMLHTLIVPRGNEYDDELDAVIAAITHLVNDFLEDFERIPKLGDPPA